jgi:hypothetical protein
MASKHATRSAAELERLSLTIGASVDDAAVDRILATIDLAGTTGILSPGVEADKLDAATATAIKCARWGPTIRWMLSFLTGIVRRPRVELVTGTREDRQTYRCLIRCRDCQAEK